MNALATNWRQDRGSIDFIQVVVGLIIIAAAAVGTLQALFYGYEQLDYEMRYRKAISIARSKVEYLQGRIHCDFNDQDQVFLFGNLTRPDVVKLDERDPSTSFDDINCYVSYGRIVPVDMVATGEGVDHWKIRVYVKWWEPGQSPNTVPSQIDLDATMVPAAL